MKLCNNFECSVYFEPKVSYQVYCSDTCREQATKEKISQRYKETKSKKRIGKDRRCRNCKEKLSVYADGPLCNFCTIDPNLVSKALKELKKLGIVDYEQK